MRSCNHILSKPITASLDWSLEVIVFSQCVGCAKRKEKQLIAKHVKFLAIKYNYSMVYLKDLKIFYLKLANALIDEYF